MNRIAVAGVVVLAAIAIILTVFRPETPTPEARAATPIPDPWAADQMRVMGSLELPDGGRMTTVRIPGWPTPMVCMAYSSPHGAAMRCDFDFPGSQGPAQ